MKMKLSLPLVAALLLLTGAPLFAQMTGTSHPEDLDDTKPVLTPDTSHYVPPSRDTPSVTITTPAPSTPTLYQRTPLYAQVPDQTAALNPAAGPGTGAVGDPDGQIVTYVPVGPNELPIGAKLNATLQQPISTQTTLPGTRFTAQLTADVTRSGVVLLPAGSLIYGRITHIHGGHRFGGASAIRLQPDSVSLPDGTVYPLHAEVTDLDHYAASRVDREGAIVGNLSTGQAVTTASLTTSAVVAGALIGGGVGAVVGLGVGAGVATVWWLKHDRQQELPTGTSIVFTLNTPLQLTAASH